MTYVFVKFREDMPGFSYEPRKWRRLFHNGSLGERIFDELLLLTEECWLSEHRTSLNLGLCVEPNDIVLEKLRRLFPGAEKPGHVTVDYFELQPGTTPIPEPVARRDVRQRVISEQETARILPFVKAA